MNYLEIDKGGFPFGKEQQDEIAQTFAHLTPAIGDSSKVERILSVACGLGWEARPALAMFPNAQYTGVDNDQYRIDDAIKNNQDLAEVRFVLGDATDQSTLGEEVADLVVVRHPNIWKDEDADWDPILHNSVIALKKGGVLFCSTYFNTEVMGVLRVLKQTRQTSTLAVLDTGSHYDKYIITATKNEV